MSSDEGRIGVAEIERARQGAGVLELPEAIPLLLSGENVRRWCNGMFTNNIRKLKEGQGNRSGMCSDRGRLQGLLDLYCIDDQAFLIVLDGVDLDWFETRYGMFMVLDDIEHESAGQTITLQGPTAAHVVSAMGLSIPELPHEHVCSTFNSQQIRVCKKDRSGLGGLDLIVNGDVSAVLAALQDAGAVSMSLAALDALRIQAGRAEWPKDGTEKSLIHELAFNEECCAFDKGCYVGQEVINRVDVRGQLSKRLMGIRAAGPLSEGMIVRHEDRDVGTLSSVLVLDGQSYGLSVVRKSVWQPGTVVSLQGEGVSVAGAVSALPFD